VPDKQQVLMQYKYISFDHLHSRSKQKNVAVDVEGVLHVVVGDISSADQALGQSNVKIRKIQLFEASSMKNRIYMFLFEEQNPLVSLLKPKDQLLIANPHLPIQRLTFGEQIFIEYGPRSVLFVVSPPIVPKEIPSTYDPLFTQDVSASQNNLTKDADGNWDFKSYLDRIYIPELPPHCINVSLFGKIIAMSTNKPHESSPRFGIRLAQETNSVDVTFFDYRWTSLRLGQFLFLEGITVNNLNNVTGCTVVPGMHTILLVIFFQLENS
jgi:hypothetical protein